MHRLVTPKIGGSSPLHPAILIMKLTKKEQIEINTIISNIDVLMESTWKRKKNKKLYIGLGQARMCLEITKYGCNVEKFLIGNAW